jgi:hypothetical protein
MLTSYVHKSPEIRYSYNFRTLPINDSDIQVLYGKMEEMVETVTNFLKLDFQYDIILPDIFISEDVIDDEYGKYTIEEIIAIFRRGIGLLKEYHGNEAVKEQLQHCEGLLLEIEGCERRGIDCSELYEMLHKQIEDLKNQLPGMDEDTRIIVETAINSIKEKKRTKTKMGMYSYQENRIYLYIKAIDSIFSKYSNGTQRDNILAGLEIVLAHEVFHAVHFHCMDDGMIVQKVRNKNKRKSVLEGLARWFEFLWCDRRRSHGGNDIYRWWMQELEREYITGNHPSDPYAASEVFLQHNMQDAWYYAYKVFKESLLVRKHHWYLTYQYMCSI